MARGIAGRPQESAQKGDSYKLAEWLNKNLDKRTDLTNEEIAYRLGYARPNIISMWRTGRTRIPLDRLTQLADILNVDLMVLIPLWLEQYCDKDGFRRIVAASSRLVSEEEAAFLNQIRQMTGDKPFRLRPGKEKALLATLEVD